MFYMKSVLVAIGASIGLHISSIGGLSKFSALLILAILQYALLFGGLELSDLLLQAATCCLSLLLISVVGISSKPKRFVSLWKMFCVCSIAFFVGNFVLDACDDRYFFKQIINDEDVLTNSAQKNINLSKIGFYNMSVGFVECALGMIIASSVTIATSKRKRQSNTASA